LNKIQTTELFDRWFDGLKDRKAKSRIQVRIDRAEEGNFGDCQPVGGGVSEMRIHHGAGYRVYFKKFGREWVILLAGGDKASQQADIKAALKLAHDLEA
jgi:putative addiction module killer protein